MSVFTDSELKRFYREAAMALREMHRDEYGRILAAIKAREKGRKIAAGNIQSPLVVVARETPEPKRVPKPTPSRRRSDAWDMLPQIRELHARRVPVVQQVQILGITPGTLDRIRKAEGLSYGGRKQRDSSLPAAPLLDLIAHRSQGYASERKLLESLAAEWGMSFDALDQAVNRAKLSGRVTERMGERFAHYLGRRVEDLWER